MGLMDRVKAQATVLAQKTQETAREGMARLDQATAARRADAMLRNLGALVYAEQTGRGAPDQADQIARLVGEISAHEAENGINLATQPDGWSAGTTSPGSAPVPFGDAGQPGPAPFGGLARVLRSPRHSTRPGRRGRRPMTPRARPGRPRRGSRSAAARRRARPTPSPVTRSRSRRPTRTRSRVAEAGPAAALLTGA